MDVAQSFFVRFQFIGIYLMHLSKKMKCAHFASTYCLGNDILISWPWPWPYYCMMGHHALTMCNNLIFICFYLHPCTFLHLLQFFPILSSIAQLYIQLFIFEMIFLFQCFVYLYLHMCIFILILFLLSVCRCCLCELDAYDTKQIPCMCKHTWQ